MAKAHAHSREFRELLKVLSLFGRPIRVVIFQRLARRPATASELSRQLPVSRVAVVQHVKLLERAGLLVGSREGKRRVYHIEPQGLEVLARWLGNFELKSTRWRFSRLGIGAIRNALEERS
jgi:DNA-binding transcriptional ArsR family regulator